MDFEDPMDEELFNKQKAEAEKALKYLNKYKDAVYYEKLNGAMELHMQQMEAGKITATDFECKMIAEEHNLLVDRMFESFK